MSAKYNDCELVIRRANKEDMVAVADMIQELADFEKMSDEPQLSVKDLQRDGFESNPAAFQCLVGELTKDNCLVGYAVYFPKYSSRLGRTMMLKDLYVRHTERGRGVGKRLFNAVAREAKASGCSRVDFNVLEWNKARLFYEGAGAVNLTSTEQRCLYRLSGDAMVAATSDWISPVLYVGTM